LHLLQQHPLIARDFPKPPKWSFPILSFVKIIEINY
jgi:hypothetical protein